MDIKKLVLYALAAILFFSLYSEWQKEHPANTASTQTEQAQHQSNVPPTFNPAASRHSDAQAVSQPTEVKHAITNGKVITVKTDVLNVEINTHGGALTQAELVKYPVSLQKKNTPIKLLNNNENQLYIAESGLTNLAAKGKTNAESVINYSAGKATYQLEPNQKELVVTLHGQAANGLQVEKSYIFKRDSYRVELQYKIINPTNKDWQGSIYNQIKRVGGGSSHSMFSHKGYTGASMYSKEHHYQKLSFKDLNDENLSKQATGGWIAMQQHYFLSAWVPSQKQTNYFYSLAENPQYGDHKVYTVGYVEPAVTVAPGKSVTTSSLFYVGPEIASRLNKVAPGLSLTIDYGWLWPISEAIFWVLAHVESVIGNWGWAIVIVTILIKLLFFGLSEKSFKSMARMRSLSPKLKTLKERHADDKQALSKATMELYRKEKINPMGGCLPMIVQIPVFIALYYVLYESVQLRQAPFIFWIQDLSAHDPYYILPVLMGISMFIQQKLTPAPMESSQAKMMMLLPVIFTVFFASFPAGLVLYWLVNNVVQSLHQWWAIKRHNNSLTKPAKKRKK